MPSTSSHFKTTQPLRVIVLIDSRLVPPSNIKGLSEQEILPFKTEYDVISTLKKLGHQVLVVPVDSDLKVIRDAISEFKPQVTFNLLEEFSGNPLFDQHVVSYLELLRQSYTGCNPRGLTIAHDKALSKKILSYHRINVPEFKVFLIGHKVPKNAKFKFPMIVKSLIEEGSVGLAQASLVYDLEKLSQRVDFMHNRHRTHVIVEQYIEGRELYVSILGNKTLQCLPIWELSFKNLPDGCANIATDKAKWNNNYQNKLGIKSERAKFLPPELEKKIYKTARTIYSILNLSGYARIDFRLTKDNQLYLLEANPNPNLCHGEEFPESAKHIGISYAQLLEKILKLGISYQPNQSGDF